MVRARAAVARATPISAVVVALVIAASAASQASPSGGLTARWQVSRPSDPAVPMRWSRQSFVQAFLTALAGFPSDRAVVGVSDAARAEEVAHAYGVRVVEKEPALRAVVVEGSQEALKTILDSVSFDTRLRYIEPVTQLQYFHQRSDPLTFTNDPATGRPYQWNFGAVHVDRALNLSRGAASVLVGIVDSGFAPTSDVPSGTYARGRYFSDTAHRSKIRTGTERSSPRSSPQQTTTAADSPVFAEPAAWMLSARPISLLPRSR